MLMDFHALVAKYDMRITGALHCGCHLAEEAPCYGNLPVTWVEANPAVLPKIEEVLADYPSQRLLHALLWETDGETKTLSITNHDGMSSSLLPFGSHTDFSPDTVFVNEATMSTRSIDSLVAEYGIEANFASLDLQGVEGPVLRGATKFLETASYVMSEVNRADVYIGATRIEELDAILAGFDRVETYWVGDQNWGDALWVKR